MKKLLVLTTLLLALIIPASLALSKALWGQDESDASLKLTVATTSNAVYTRSKMPVRITFENVGDQDVRLLKPVDELNVLPAFFKFDLVGGDGKSIFIPGAGKVSFFEGSMKYVTLRRGEKFKMDLNLAKVISPATPVPEGEYSLTVGYHNQYGTDCFKGNATSNAIQVYISGQ